MFLHMKVQAVHCRTPAAALHVMVWESSAPWVCAVLNSATVQGSPDLYSGFPLTSLLCARRISAVKYLETGS